MNKLSGHIYAGVLKGVKEVPYTDDNGDPQIAYRIGISNTVDDGFGGKVENVYEMPLPKKLYESALPQIKQFMGQYVLCQQNYNFNYKRFSFPENGIIYPYSLIEPKKV